MRAPQPVGDPRQCHAMAVDARAPRFDGGIVTRLDSLPFGIVVNRHAERFYDEGEDVWPKRYAIWGRLIAAQPDQIAYSIVDAKAHRQRSCRRCFRRSWQARSASSPACSTLPAGRARGDGRRVQPGGPAGHVQSRRARRLPHRGADAADKTHWAQRIDTPPFWGYPLRPGITFTYLGLKVDESRARGDEHDGAPPRTSTPPARSWPATSSARATSPASA